MQERNRTGAVEQADSRGATGSGRRSGVTRDGRPIDKVWMSSPRREARSSARRWPALM